VFAVIYIPDFFLQAALRSEPELCKYPVALVDSQLAKPVIVQVTQSARQQGICSGLTPSQAVARCPKLLIKNRSSTQEQSAAEVLLQSAYGFSPCIEHTSPGVCTLELKGLRLDSETAAQEWAGKILKTLSQFHLEAQIGFGSNPNLALIVAQAAVPVLWTENPELFILSLPIESLHPAPQIREVLGLWGVSTIGEFLSLGKNQIAERLGPSALDLLNALDSVRPLKLVSPPAAFIERIEFEHEIETTEPLLFVLNRFVEQLARRLDAIYLVITELQLELIQASGARHGRTFKIPSPTNNQQLLFRMLQTHLETLTTESSIVALELRASPGTAERHQFGLFDATLRDPNQFAETLARLTVLCGRNNVGTPQLESTYRPDAFVLKTPDFSAETPENPTNQPVRQGPQLRRFRPAVPAQVEFREQRPALIRSRPCTGPITAVHGPFASSGDWWEQSSSWAREEWDVQIASGPFFRIFRSPPGCFIEGVYD
jgi:protein ImuB